MAIGSGQGGGPMAAVGPLVGKFAGAESRPIRIERDGMRRSVLIPGMLDIAVEGIPGASPSEPIYLDNVGHPAASRLALAKASRATCTPSASIGTIPRARSTATSRRSPGARASRMGPRLQDKRALVTGGSRGIGAAIVKRLAREGADVALTYVSKPDEANKTAAAARALGVRALAIQADSAMPRRSPRRSSARRRSSAASTSSSTTPASLAMAPIDDFSLEDFDRTFAINVRAVFVATQAAVKHMKEGGRIINIGSCNAERMPFAGGAVYAMSKAALVGLVKGLARDLGPRGITINNVQPGPVDTDMNPRDRRLRRDAEEADGPAALRHADEIAAMVAYLAGPEAGFVTGASLTIDGGFTA